MVRLIQLIILYLTVNIVVAQKFDIDTLLYNGNPDKYINLVMLGDGYTDGEQNKFLSNAKSLSNYMFSIEPWKNYISHFNVFAIKVISQQSGIIHPRTAPDCPELNSMPVIAADPYFGTTFDFANIHRLVVPKNSARIAQVLALNFPLYDQVMIVANSTYYGGSGGQYATSTIASSANEITAHELGHSFAGLSDEYYAGDQYARENHNMTKETNPALVRWRNWLQHKNVGIYQHCCGSQSAMWYKPHQNCKMNVLNKPFCPVCVESFIERIHKVNPIVSFYPSNAQVINTQRVVLKLDTLMKPTPNSLQINWYIDNIPVKRNVDSLVINDSNISSGEHTIAATVIDTSILVRAENHSSSHLYFVEWQINKLATSVKTISNIGSIEFNIFPNPSPDKLKVKIESSQERNYEYKIFRNDGSLLKSKIFTDKEIEIDVTDLPSGTYLFELNFDYKFKTLRTFIKI